MTEIFITENAKKLTEKNYKTEPILFYKIVKYTVNRRKLLCLKIFLLRNKQN